MRKFSLVAAAIVVLSLPYASGQKQIDSTSILYAFKNGKVSGHFRMFYMSTNNARPLTDYYALAFGGGLKYQTKSFKGFQFGVGGFYIWNLASSDLTAPDPVGNVINRYETGQFDQTDPSNKKDLQRLEDFFIKYNYKNSYLKFGKQVIKSPFVNPQDGRMRPTGEQGLWAEINELKRTKIEIGWLTHISPRGTMKWYRGASSIGIYPGGVTISGEKSDYKSNVESHGIGIAGVTYAAGKRIKLQAWNSFVENIFNTVLIQADGELTVTKNKKIIAAVQYINQSPIDNGGHGDPTKTYFDVSQKSNSYGFRIVYLHKNSGLKFNYTRITRHGRFLFPREWGREPFFTFLPRERNEGMGDVNAFTINVDWSLFNRTLVVELGAGYYDLPDVRNYRLNKYGMPSYYQLNLNTKYSFNCLLNGLNLELLYLYKGKPGDVYEEWKYVINKVNMHQVNFILNYNF